MEGYLGIDKADSERKTGKRWRKNAEVRISQLVEKEIQPEQKTELREIPQLKPIEIRRHVNAEASTLHGGVKPESIGQVLVTAAESKSKVAQSFEARAERAIGNTATRSHAEAAPTLTIDTYVETISREDMLELAGKIEVDGSTLRQMYETHLVAEKALRRLIAEHLKGGNLQEAVRKEMIEHEIDFERDPQLRDKDHLHAVQAQHYTAPVRPPQFEHAAIEEAKPRTVRTKRRQTRKAKRSEPQMKKNGALDALMYTIIIVLLFLVIVLALKK